MAGDAFAPLGSTPAPGPARAEWRAVLPAPHPLPASIRHGKHGTPAAIWHYRDAAGALLFAVARFDTPKGKEVLPYCCGADGWRWKAPPTPRPLYGLEALATRPDAPVIVVEGEKAADAAARLFPAHVAVTWQGGCAATGKANWMPMGGRRVTVWPDNDDDGRKAATEAAKALRAAGADSVAIVHVPREWPKGWDVADALPDDVALEQLAVMLDGAATAGSAGDALLADVARAAAMDRAEWLTARRDMAKRHGVPVGELDAMRAEAQRDGREADAAEAAQQSAPADARGRVDLFVNGADLPDTAAELATLLASVPHLFDRAGPARIARDATRGGMVVESLSMNGVVSEAHRIARPWRYVKTRDGAMERADITLPERVARLYLDDRAGWGLRPLDGITSAPLLHEDGSVRAVDGYDDETRLWCERVPPVAVPEHPAREDAAAALLVLRRHFRTLAFADATRVMVEGQPVPVVDVDRPPGADESAMLAALLTAVCRPCLWLAPGLLARAPEYSGAGTGKGLAVRAICAIAFGTHPQAITAGANGEELDKRLTAALMEAGAALFLDNVNGTALKSDVLASAITERPAAVRPLGQSKTVRLNPTCFVAVTGNGVLLSEDLARRFMVVELDAGMENPEARAFRGDFIGDTMHARESLLAAALTIWRWGRQQGDALPAGAPLGSFNQWGRWCRDPLLALGCKDPVLRVADAKAKDPRRQAVAEIFAAWNAAHGATPVAVAELADGVRLVADPNAKGRQYLAARIRALDGTRAAGFLLTREASIGKWSPDKYTLRPADAAPATHGGHRGHGGPAPETPGNPLDGAAAAGAGAAGHRGWHGGEHRGGSTAPDVAENLGGAPMPPMTPMPLAGDASAVWEDDL